MTQAKIYKKILKLKLIIKIKSRKIIDFDLIYFIKLKL